MDSADSHLPFQDWRWLVTRRDADEKPIVALNNSVFDHLIVPPVVAVAQK
ncbi:hypothetical protein [Mesorhizobium sp. 113-3-3]|nr:hypothetical protein [Mesorhizobium sp. 113-3-3]